MLMVEVYIHGSDGAKGKVPINEFTLNIPTPMISTRVETSLVKGIEWQS